MTTIEKLESYLLITISTDFRPKVQEFIDAVTAYVERYTGRTFTPVTSGTAATARTYDGNDTSELFIDDAVEVTQVKIGDTILASTDFRLYPSNRLPKTRIILPYKIFTWGAQNVTVTAKWGYGASVPKDLEFAATLLVADMINSSDTNDSKTVASETIGRYSVSYVTDQSKGSPEALQAHKILKLYRRMS